MSATESTLLRKEMSLRVILQELRGAQTWKRFHQLTGFSCAQLWKMEHLGHSCPPKKVKVLSDIAQKCGRPLSQKEIMTLLLGEHLAGRLADLDLLMKGRNPLDIWLRSTSSQRDQAKILGLHYSTIFRRRTGKFKRFWPKRAVEIARRSNYEIDLFDLLGCLTSDNQAPKIIV